MENDISQNLNVNMLPPFGIISHKVILDTNVVDDFSNDISQMPDNPPKYTGHRRAHSEIVTLPDDLSFDSDLGVVGGFDGNEETENETETEEELFYQVDDSSHVQTSNRITPMHENHVYGSGDGTRVKHHHSMSVDGCTTFKPEEASLIDDKKSMSNAKLAELALVDPKRAKRIWANRQSAIRSKERKIRYIAELERKVQTLKTGATPLSAQLTILRRDTHGLTVENNDLKLRLQAMEHQVHLQDALNDALKHEIQHLKVLLTGHNLTNGAPMMNFPPSFGPNQRFHPNNQTMQTMLTAQQFQQLQIQSRNHHQHQQQQHLFHQPQLQFWQQQQQLHQFQQQQQQQQQQQNFG